MNEWYRNGLQITNGRSLKQELISLEFSNEYEHLFFSKACTELAFSTQTRSATKGPSQSELHGKWGERKHWETSAVKTFPLSPAPVFGSSPVAISFLPLGIAKGFACHLQFVPAYDLAYALFSPLRGVLLPGRAAQFPSPSSFLSWSSCCSDAGWRCFLWGNFHAPKHATLPNCLHNPLLPSSTTGSCWRLSALFPSAFRCQKWTIPIFQGFKSSVFWRCYTELLARSLYNIYLCFLFRTSVVVFFPSHIWKVKQSMVWWQTLRTLHPLKAACLR